MILAAAFLAASQSDGVGMLVVAVMVGLGVLGASSGATCINCGTDFRRTPGTAARCPSCGKRWDRYA